MHGQLERLAEAAELPNVTIQVLPFKGNHALTVDSFSILQFGGSGETAFPDIVTVEYLSNELHVEDDTDAHTLRLSFSHLTAKSLSPGESRALITVTRRHDGAEGSEPARPVLPPCG